MHHIDLAPTGSMRTDDRLWEWYCKLTDLADVIKAMQAAAPKA